MRALLLAVLLASPLHAQIFVTGEHTRTAPDATARAAVNQALAKEDYAGALKLLEPLRAAAPGDAELAYDAGLCQDALDQAPQAQQSYRAAIAADPKMLAPRVALGVLLARSGQVVEARTMLADAVALPAAPASSSSGSAPPAPSDFDRALLARAYRALAQLDQKTRPADARVELLAALKLSPATADDSLLAAELAQADQGATPDTEAAYRKVLAERPGDPDATAALARLLAAGKRPEEARKLLTDALVTSPGNPALTVQLASLLATSGKTAEAAALLEPVADAHPEDVNLARVLARIQVESGADAKAEPVLARLSQVDPQNVDLADLHARALIHLRRYAQAQPILARIVALPDRFSSPAALGDAAGDLAFAASENNDPAGALRAIQLRATVLPPSPAVLFLAAISEDRLHHVQQAREAYRQFLAAAHGSLPDEEFEARHRLVALEHVK